MAVIIEATKGHASANSYITLADAGTFIEELYGDSDLWIVQSEENRKKLLISASKQIDKMPIKYDSTADTQALKFPVDTLSELTDTDDDGWDAVVMAVCYQALHILKTYEAQQEAGIHKISGVKSESASGLSKTFAGHNWLTKWSPDTIRLLIPYCDWSIKLKRYED